MVLAPIGNLVLRCRIVKCVGWTVIPLPGKDESAVIPLLHPQVDQGPGLHCDGEEAEEDTELGRGETKGIWRGKTLQAGTGWGKKDTSEPLCIFSLFSILGTFILVLEEVPQWLLPSLTFRRQCSTSHPPLLDPPPFN